MSLFQSILEVSHGKIFLTIFASKQEKKHVLESLGCCVLGLIVVVINVVLGYGPVEGYFVNL